MTGAWTIRHFDLREQRPDIGTAAGGGLYGVFWWGALPLGRRIWLAEELPLRDDQVICLAADLLSTQISVRVLTPGGIASPSADGTFHGDLPLDAAVTHVPDTTLLDDAATPSTRAADDLAVIVCTRDRPQELARCLASLRQQRHPPGEILVVDNSAGGSAAAVCAAMPDVRTIHEPRAGLSIARNAGIAACRRPLLAFTDDDAEAHPNWTAELVRAFDDPRTDAVTGLVLPSVLDTPAQQAFEHDMGAFNGQFVPVRYDRTFIERTRHLGPQVWCVGAGANMAFRRSVFVKAGLFDERLGAGASGCAEDSEFWYRILAGDGICLVEPRAVVFHRHRPEWGDLRRQVRAYLRGHVSALVVQSDRYGDAGNRARFARQLPRHFLRTAFKTLRDGRYRRLRLVLDEVLGWLAGSVYWWRRSWRRSDGGIWKQASPTPTALL